ncbi:hypothetical protein EBH_0023530 [Eimeria brunetti]|uniref:Uncharacterized protein n=1 Tax=Eimeria brunetti TaxID=51314 RepID=U6LFU7_9EIME|nr:hypothetical protein EBH_0023530 [Eimeria brunetti]
MASRPLLLAPFVALGLSFDSFAPSFALQLRAAHQGAPENEEGALLAEPEDLQLQQQGGEGLGVSPPPPLPPSFVQRGFFGRRKKTPKSDAPSGSKTDLTEKPAEGPEDYFITKPPDQPPTRESVYDPYANLPSGPLNLPPGPFGDLELEEAGGAGSIGRRRRGKEVRIPVGSVIRRGAENFQRAKATVGGHIPIHERRYETPEEDSSGPKRLDSRSLENILAAPSPDDSQVFGSGGNIPMGAMGGGPMGGPKGLPKSPRRSASEGDLLDMPENWTDKPELTRPPTSSQRRGPPPPPPRRKGPLPPVPPKPTGQFPVFHPPEGPSTSAGARAQDPQSDEDSDGPPDWVPPPPPGKAPRQ